MSRKLLTAIIILTLCFIWGHSLVPAEASQEESYAVGDFLTPFLELFFGEGKVTDHLVRKLAHMAEYALLGAEFTLLFLKRKNKLRTVLSHCFLVAFLDETIQIFNGRGPFISDVWIDLAGSSAAMAIVLLVSLIIKPKTE